MHRLRPAAQPVGGVPQEVRMTPIAAIVEASVASRHVPPSAACSSCGTGHVRVVRGLLRLVSCTGRCEWGWS